MQKHLQERLSLISAEYDVIVAVAKRKQSRIQLMGGKMKLLSGKTALRWLSATRAATKTGGQASDLCRNPTTSWGCPFMLQKGFFLAPINSNAVINLFLYSLLKRERVSTESLASGRAWTLWDQAKGQRCVPCLQPTMQTRASL